MESNVEDMWKRLKLTDEEEQGVIVGNDSLNMIQTGSSFCLLGSLWTTKSFNCEVMKKTMRTLWQPTKGMKTMDIGENLFLFQFYHLVDRHRVLSKSLWTFDKHVLMLQPIEGEIHPNEFRLHRASFWVRVHGLSYLCLNKKVGEAIGNCLGRFEEIDIPEGGGSGHILRIRVSLDLEQPIKRGLNFGVGSMSKSWIHFKYEKLPNFCYFSGHLGHVERDCDKSRQARIRGEKMDFQYGQWL